MPARWILCGQADEYSDDDEMMRGRGKEEEDRGALPNEHELGPNKVVKGWRPWPVRRGCTGHRTWRCNAPGLTRGRVREPDPSSLHVLLYYVTGTMTWSTCMPSSSSVS